MHDTAKECGRLFFDLYGGPPAASVLDLGACDVNGSLREVAPPHLRYTGVDLAPGRGVDIVLDDPHRLPFADASFDLIVSSSCFEHDACFWLTFLEALRVLRPDGYFYLNVPSNGPVHAFPQDHWRFYPDAGLALQRWAERQGRPVSLVESGIVGRAADLWNDFIAVFQPGPPRPRERHLVDVLPATTNCRTSRGGPLERPAMETEDARLLREARARLQMLEHQVEALERELALVKSSRSWQLTRPLRDVHDRLR